MEQFVLGIFQEQLSKFIVGFRKEQVNANLLNGKGEIVDVHLNCSFLNAQLKRVTPFIELQSVHVSKLSFHVTSWTNIKKAPICVDIEDVTATIVEPLEFLDKTKRKTFQQLTKQDYLRLFAPKSRGPYNLFDRILDNLELEIRMVRLTFTPRGKFKSKTEGPWTPPKLSMTLRHLKYSSVDEFGNEEATPEECWKHNNFVGVRPEKRVIMIYKKASMKVTIEIEGQRHQQQQKSNLYDNPSIPPLMKDVSTSVHIAFKKRWVDAAFLGVQMDTTMEQMEVLLDNATIPDLVHAMAGMQYCLSKNRPFQDPLKSVDEQKEDASNEQIEMASNDEGTATVTADDTSTIGMDETKLQQIIELSLEEDEMSIAEEAATPPDATSGTVAAAATDTASITSNTGTVASSTTSAASAPSQPSINNAGNRNERPVMIFPSGLVIHENVSITLAIHNCQVRGVYAKRKKNSNGAGDDSDDDDNNNYDPMDGGDFIQIDCRGIVAEALWPKATGERGGSLQASISYVSIQEIYGTRIRTILRGGIQPNYGKSSSTRANKPVAPKLEVSIDEFFPLFEDRSIRPDPLDLRHSFPAQAVGVKSTISLVNKVSNPVEEEFHVLHELGVDRFEIIFDTESWCRVLRFALNEVGGGFDPRWHSGDWSDELTPQMLVNPSEPLNLDEHLQKAREIFFDENNMISSDLFNVTAKITNVSLRVPAAICENARSCDIVVVLGEMMLMVSSALPRTILTGKLGTSIYGDNPNKEAPIVFPNDPSDICYQMNDAEDPLVRQQGEMMTRKVSTFRLQLTTRGFSLNLVPVIPYCNAPNPQELLSPLEMTMIVCFEGEPPETPDSDLIKIGLFLSMQVHQVVVNLDFDVIMGAISTVLYHTRIVKQTLEDLLELSGLPQTLKQSFENAPTKSSSSTNVTASVRVDTPPMMKANNETTPIASGIRGRRVLVRRQLERSRRTGGLGLDINIQVGGFQLNIWRQNVPILTRFRASVLQQQDNSSTKSLLSQPLDHKPMKLIKLLGLDVEGIELSLEGSVQQENKRLILKTCLTKVGVDICDFDRECLRHRNRAAEQKNKHAGSSDASKSFLATLEEMEVAEVTGGEDPVLEPIMVRLISLDSHPEVEVDTKARQGLSLRMEDWKEDEQALSLSVLMDVDGAITLHIHEIENFLLLFMEGLLMPTDVRYIDQNGEDAIHESMFPSGSTAAVLSSIVTKASTKTTSNDDKRSSSVQTQSIDAHDPAEKDAIKSSKEMIEIVDKFVLQMLPPNISILLLHADLGEIAVFVPHQEGVDMTVDPECPWFRVSLQQLLLRSRYFSSANIEDGREIMNVLSHEAPWSKVFKQTESGFYHSLRLQQSIDAVAPNNSGTLTSTLVPSFGLGGEYYADRFSVDMVNSVLSVQDFENVSHLSASVLCFKARIVIMVERIESIVAAMEARKEAEKQNSSGDKNTVKIDQDHYSRKPRFNSSVADVKTAIISSRSHFETLKMLIEKQDVATRTLLEERQDTIDKLYIQVFLKEKARLAALALVSTQAAGWIRVGGMHIYGQRAPSTSSMWRYFAVLRKSLLIMYSGPGKMRPVDVVCLQGARLMSLAGGRRKRDIKFGFSICENSGTVRFFLLPNGPEFETWIKELQKAIDTYTTTEFMKSNNNPAREDFSLGISAEDDVAESKNSSLDVEDDISLAETPKKLPIFKERLKGMAANTRNKVETAVQSARELRENNAENGDNAETSNDLESLTSASMTVTEATTAVQPAIDEISETKPSEERNVFLNELNSTNPSRTDNEPMENIEQSGEEDKTQTTDLDPSESSLDMIKTESSENQNAFGRFTSMRTNAKTMRVNAKSIRANAKNRFGNAMQIAREKAQAVAEEQRQRRERNRIQNDSMHSVESGATPVAANSNPLRNRTFSSNSFDSESVGSAETESETSGRGQQFRDRFSKIGASLRQVGHAGNEEDSAKPMFKFRPTFGSQQSTSEESDFVKLKSILLDPSHPASGNQSALPSAEKPNVSRLQGTWTTTVRSVLPAKKATSTATIPCNENSIPPQPPVEDNPEDYGTANDTNPSGLSIGVSSESFNTGKRKFQIDVNSPDLSADKKISMNSTMKSFSDVVQFYLRISDPISGIFDKMSASFVTEGNTRSVDNDDVEANLGIAPMDIVKLTMNLFEGLLDTSSKIQTIPQFHEYQCEVLQEFLNSLLICPLPKNGRDLLLQFLDIKGNRNWEFAKGDELTLLGPKKDDSIDFSRDIVALSTACHAELLRAETNFALATKLHNPSEVYAPGPKIPVTPRKVLARVHSLSSTAPYLDPLLPTGITEGLRDAMYEALMTVMAERDEAQAQLIAASVLHVHEMESERKKMDLLQEKLRLSQEETKQNSKQGIFGDRFKRQSSAGSLYASHQDLHKYQEQVIESTDSELVGLCQQLAGEISAKTSANLEVLRLRESRKIEREQDATERQALQEELQRAKEELAAEKERTRVAEEEAKKLRELSHKQES